jgi:DNA-binding MarR family transcriptional regulator
MDRLTDQELSAWRFFIKSHARIIEQIERDLEEEKRVPLSTYDVLIALFEAQDRRLRLQDLTKKVIITKSGLTRLLDRIEKEGLIRRERSETDRRGFYAVLTEEGEQQLRKAWPIYAKGIKSYFASPLSSEELEVVQKAFTIVHGHMEQLDGGAE